MLGVSVRRALLLGVYVKGLLIFGNPHMAGYQNYGPFLGPLNISRSIFRTQTGSIILTTPHINIWPKGHGSKKGLKDWMATIWFPSRILCPSLLWPYHPEYQL